MAVTPSDTNKAFLREVDEELRREQIATVWSRYGAWIVLGVVALLIAVAGALWWRAHREATRGVEGEQLQAAFDTVTAGNIKDASAKLTPLASSGTPGYRALARMTQADILLQKQDLRGAARLFAAVVGDDGVGRPLRDLALLRQTSAEFDTLQPAVVVQRLKPLAAKGNAYFGGAGELVAISYIRMGKRDLAAQLYGQIGADDLTPATLRQRAVQMAGLLGTPAAPQAKDHPAT